MRFTTATVAAVAALLSSVVIADKNERTFAVLHFYGNGPLVTARADPVVNPGAVAPHLHTIMGGNAFAMDMPGTAAKEATCTNARIKNDKSNYWTPSLFFHNGNGTFIPVPMFYMNVYYFFEATDDDIKAFPDGFRMLSGDSSLRSGPAVGGTQFDPNGGPIQPVQFTCPRSQETKDLPLYTPGAPGVQDPNNKGAGSGFPDRNCDGFASPLRADIHFPSCYNPAAGPENYKENTAWPTSKGASKGGRSNCPAGWIHTPHIFFEVYWNTPLFKNEWTPGQGKQPFILSNGDPTGYSLHGDFVNGWDTPTLQKIIDTCNAGDSGMEKCPQIIGGLSDDSTSCNIQSPVQETVTGHMEALPGCNPIQSGPAAAQKMTCANGAAVPAVIKDAKPVSSAASSAPAASSPSVAQVVTRSATTMSTQTRVATPSALAAPTSAKIINKYSTSTVYHTKTHTKHAAPKSTKKATKSKKHFHRHRSHHARDGVLDSY